MHTVSNGMRQKPNMFLKKEKKQMQIMKDKRKIDSGIRGPGKTAVKKKLITPVDVSESDKFIQVHTSFFCNFLKETICSACSKKCVSASITERNGLCVKVVLYCKNCDTIIGENLQVDEWNLQIVGK